MVKKEELYAYEYYFVFLIKKMVEKDFPNILLLVRLVLFSVSHCKNNDLDKREKKVSLIHGKFRNTVKRISYASIKN